MDSKSFPMGPDLWSKGDPIPTYEAHGESHHLVSLKNRKKLTASVFEVIVSSNVRASLEDHERNTEVSRSLKMASNWLFGESWKDPEFLDIFDIWTGPKGHTTKTGDFPKREDIAWVKWNPGRVEYGEHKKGRRIHYAGTLEVGHYTKLRVNQKRCQTYMNYLCTFTKDRYVWPIPPSRAQLRSPHIKGTYVNSSYIHSQVQAEIYNQKTLIVPYMEHLKNGGEH